MGKWPLEHFVELFALLDYSLSHEGVSFQDTIVGHIQASCGKEYTSEQVRRKIRSVWTTHGPTSDSPYIWNDLYDRGSSILPGLSDEEAEGIAKAYERLEDSATAKLLSASEQPRTRSASKSGAFRFSPHVSLETVQPKYSARRYNRGQTGSVTPCPAKRESEPVDFGINESPISRKKTKSSSPLKPITPPYRIRSKHKERHRPDGSVTKTQIEVEKTEAHNKLERKDRVATKQSQDREEELDNDDGEQIPETPSSNTASEPEDSTDEDSLAEENQKFMSKIRLRTKTERRLTARLVNTTAQMITLQHELNRKQSQLEKEQEKAKKLQTQKNTLQSAQQERDFRSGEPFEELIRRKDQYIDKLTRLLEDRKSLGCFTKSFELSPTKREKTSLNEDFEDIYSQCQHIPCQYDSNRPVFIPNLSLQEDLRVLVCRGLGVEPHDSAWAEKVNVDFSKLSPQAIVRAVTTSALREWVFETNFPRIRNESKLLVKYRESVASLDGVQALRNLDLAAHSAIIKSDSFQKQYIPRKARKLARRLSKALAVFFVEDPDDPRESDLRGFNKWGQTQKECVERQAIFENICAAALRAKAKSVLNLEHYRMDIYPPGTAFDKSTMEVETAAGIPQRKGDFEGRVILLSVEAAIFCWPKGALGDDAAKFMGEAVVHSRNFSHTVDVRGEGGRLMVHARVILKEEQPLARNRSVSDTMSDSGTSSPDDISTPTEL